MLRLTFSRFLQIIPTMLVSSLVIFSLVLMIPGDPAITLAGESATPKRIAQIRADYGLDKPAVERYVIWVGNAVQGDLSKSMTTGEPVVAGILRRLPKTMLLAVGATLLSVLIGLIIGMMAAVNRGGRIDSLVSGLIALGVAVPSFWLAMILVYIFAIRNRWFPLTGAEDLSRDPIDALHHAFLPILAIAASGVAEVASQLRSAMIEVLCSPFITTLRAKGLSSTSIIWKHGLRNVSVAMFTVTGLLFNRLLGGVVIIEIVFAIPGLGPYVIEAAFRKDFPVIQGVLLVSVVIVVLTNLIVDICCRLADPRILEGST